jgi:hypothetical protein
MLDAAICKRLAQLLAMGSSAYAGERATALQMADELVRKHNTTWAELFGAAPGGTSVTIGQLQHRLEVATEACQYLQRENEQLRADLARAAKAAVNGAAGPAAALLGDCARQARWILELHNTGEIHLRGRDREFCETVSGWRGELTDRQKPWFASLLDKVCRTTGKPPP